MYSGYRIMINGHRIENVDIARGSYSTVKKRRVLASYYDAAGRRHEVLSRHETRNIELTIREMGTKEYAERICPALEKKERAEVSYWDDEAQEYRSGIFRIQEYALSHANASKEGIWYQQIPIVLEEY